MMIRTLGFLCMLSLLDLTFSQSACPTGKWGTLCDKDCNANCALNCEREKGTCYGCVLGRYDRYCDNECPDCKFGCDQNTGLCQCDMYGCLECDPTNSSHCAECDGTRNFIPSFNDPLRCCSDGCKRASGGVVNCDFDGICYFKGDCDSDGYWGDKCTKCSETITHCETCGILSATGQLICDQCWPNYELSNDKLRCCPVGCDDCITLPNANNIDVDYCSVCKSGYYIYGQKCDTCGGNCQAPAAGPPEARCDSVTGHCLYGCLPDWHGAKCDIECTLANCDTCKYEDPNLTCETCAVGWAPSLVSGLCEQCNANCVDGECDPTTGVCLKGCVDGWRADRCDVSCADVGLENCTACGRYDVSCSQCLSNNWGPLCQNSCSGHCMGVQGTNNVCDKDTAACFGGCRPGYWRADCNLECPNCLNDTCAIIDGTCTENACKPGFWDDNCEMACSQSCATSPPTNMLECRFADGFCTHGCTYNTYGNTCQLSCNSNCYDNRTTAAKTANEPLCEQNDGECMYGCAKGYYQSNCNQPCGSTCVTGDCDRDKGYCLACDETPKGWLCYDGACEVGKHGQFCQANCSGGDNCLNNTCNRFNGDCDACVKGRWGADCEFECPTCAEGLCNQADGVCTKACIAGTWGSKCQLSCHERCEGCDRTSGSCVLCEVGRYGTTCELNCSQNCLPSANGVIRCDKIKNNLGYCDEEACKSGFFGLACKATCSENCAGNENGTIDCDIYTGKCSYNCKDGWYGDLCTGECLESCRDKKCIDEPDICVDGCSDYYYGERCRTPCSVGCKDGRCDDVGVCIEGCENEQFGEMCERRCNETCIDDQCNRQTGICEFCSNFTADNFYMCRTANCAIGEYGQYCNTTCPGGENCLGNTCNRYTSFCDACIAGQWGDICQNNCSTCQDGSCDQNTGTCTTACVDGYFGQKCLDRCLDRCDVCNRNDGSCLVCTEATYGPLCQSNCSRNCALKDGKLLCDKVTGSCSSGACVPGYFGLKCNNECYEHCRAMSSEVRAICDYNTGYCTNGCQQGWYGLLCTGQCSSTCRNNNCYDDSNNCLDGCTDNYWGPMCLNDCSDGCSLNICDDDGICLAECITNRYGPMCTETCFSTCIDDLCDRQTGNCSECTKQNPSMLCRTALCNPGVYGLKCDQPCPSTQCLNNRCSRYTGSCEGCNTGLYGQYCRSQCNNCVNGTCNQDSGRCLNGCLNGWYGERCDMRCASCVKCIQSSGICTECPAEKYGDNCQNDCSSNCLPTLDGYRSCDIYTAACASLACTNGFYGPDCVSPCHSNCGENEDGVVLCNFNTGACTANCTNLYYGPHCDKDCISYCHDKTCDRVEGICADCKPIQGCPDCVLPPNCPKAICTTMFWGQDCTDPCPQRCDSRGCDRYTAKCVGCLPGFRGDKCNQTCLYQGCYTCAQSTGLCESCNAGKYGTNCDLDCGGCAPVNGEVRCDMMTGRCQTEDCQPGRWGTDCSQRCSENCADINGTNFCDRMSGECSFGCDVSYFGPYCEQNCSSTCKNKNCMDSANNCQEGCALGYYGPPGCLNNCNINCLNNNCDENDGYCNEGCRDGFYSDQCSKPCNQTCINNKCDRNTGMCPECTITTSNPYYFCRTKDCEAGKQGNLCDTFCPNNCAETCGRYTGRCDGCDSGYYGANCTDMCPNCLNLLCDQTTGVCNDGCSPGYFDPYCSLSCKFDGCETCDRGNGNCLRCKPQLFGIACERDCSSYCSPSATGDHLCEKDTGTCLEGSCLPGWWGLDCFQECNMNCLQNTNGVRSCYYQDGTCSSGCVDKFWGDQCDRSCSDRCMNEMCDRDSTCLFGCVPGAYGPSCEFDCKQTCNDGTCDRDFGTCAECNKTLDQQTELCRTAPCPIGRQGLLCDIPCPTNCVDSCNRYNSTCDACKSGFYGDHCNLTCSNCLGVSCNQDTGTCDQGCLNGWYGLKCLKSCPDVNCESCDRITGGCLQCKPTFYGFNCSKMCSSFCAPFEGTTTVRCDRNTGSCSSGICQPGYYLSECTKSCNDNCGADFNDNRPCGLLTGKCQYDCIPGWHGDMCDRQCSDGCAEGICNRTGFCFGAVNLACTLGHYGSDCRLICPEPQTCNDGRCHRFNGNCSACAEPAQAPECRDAACPKGTWGLNCDQTCPPNCQGGGCIRETGLCEACMDMWFGNDCNSPCLNCQDNICFQSTGVCIKGCKDGWYTNTCNTPCLYTGCKDCTRDNGTCIECKVGKYNASCSADCSPHCALTDMGRECNKASGNCDAGQCIVGYWRETCQEECSPYCATTGCELTTGACSPCKVGWFGTSCRQACSDHCKNKKCLGTYDTCVDGCADGWWGPTCQNACNQNCIQGICNITSGTCLLGCVNDMYFGATCLEPCNVNCAQEDGSRGGQCERNGYCRLECVTGTYGDKCENNCPVAAQCTDGTCHRKNGNCSECDAIEPGPLCPSAECRSGKWGKDCQNDCSSSTCLYNRCTRDDDICVGCPIGLYGSLCAKTCGQCKVGTGCNQISGICDEGCRAGYQGDKCDTRCADSCETCERYGTATQCVTCIDNRWGDQCEKTCSSNCAKTIIGSMVYTRCDKATGSCSLGACLDNRFWRSNCSEVCPANCKSDINGIRTCRITDGQCSEGCQNTYFGPQCTQECSTQCRDKLCVNSRNNCINGCATGFYNPPTCSGTCSQWCAQSTTSNTESCNSSTGYCEFGCMAGYFGNRCVEQCYGKCVDGTCDSLGGCPDCRLDPVGPQCYPQVCPALKYGPSCESDCPGLYCLNSMCQRQTGKCPQGCQTWFHGEYCTEKCICDQTGTESCDQNGVCTCKTGRTNIDCSGSCSAGCLNGVCSKNGQCTEGCIDGRYGSQCDMRCSNCVNEDCDETTGECNQGCKSGYFGSRCEEACSINCLSCQTSAAVCTECISFRYGPPTCTQTCSATCKQVASGRVCSESTGTCIEGCADGYYGSKCDKQCSNCGGTGACSIDGQCSEGCQSGYFGTTCGTPCASGCARGGTSNARKCDFTTGECEYGCATGFYGSTCLACSESCLNSKCSGATVCTDGCVAFRYGKNSGCINQCTNCKNGICDDEGVCTVGCQAGSYGDKCQTPCVKTCTDNTCDQTSGTCAACSTMPVGALCRDSVSGVTAAQVQTDERLSTEAIIGITAGCAGAIIIIIIFAVCCVFYRRQATDAKKELHLPSDMLEGLSAHRSHHSTISSQYPVARVVGDDEKDFVLF